MTNPTVGRTVHYRAANTAPCRAAVVTAVFPGVLDLTVLPPAAMPFPATAKEDAPDDQDSWHWPEREPDSVPAWEWRVAPHTWVRDPADLPRASVQDRGEGNGVYDDRPASEPTIIPHG